MANEKVTIYDPAAQAYREVSREDAQKFVDSAKKVEAYLNASNEEETPNE